MERPFSGVVLRGRAQRRSQPRPPRPCHERVASRRRALCRGGRSQALLFARPRLRSLAPLGGGLAENRQVFLQHLVPGATAQLLVERLLPAQKLRGA